MGYPMGYLTIHPVKHARFPQYFQSKTDPPYHRTSRITFLYYFWYMGAWCSLINDANRILYYSNNNTGPGLCDLCAFTLKIDWLSHPLLAALSGVIFACVRLLCAGMWVLSVFGKLSK